MYSLSQYRKFDFRFFLMGKQLATFLVKIFLCSSMSALLSLVPSRYRASWTTLRKKPLYISFCPWALSSVYCRHVLWAEVDVCPLEMYSEALPYTGSSLHCVHLLSLPPMFRTLSPSSALALAAACFYPPLPSVCLIAAGSPSSCVTAGGVYDVLQEKMLSC